MSIRRICRQVDVWPAAIADMIADYAGIATEDKIRALIGADTRASKRSPPFTYWCHPVMLNWYGVLDGNWIMLGRYNLPERHISAAELAAAIDAREWPWIIKTPKRRREPEEHMSADELEALVYWVGTSGLK